MLLKDHFKIFYKLLADAKIVPNAEAKEINNVFRCFSGISGCYHNALIGKDEAIIEKQIEFFKNANVPFVWYIDEDEEFKNKLMSYGFKDGGIFQGVSGALESPFNVTVPENCTFEQVVNEKQLNEFVELVCKTFGMDGIKKEFCKVIKNPQIDNWLARKDGKAVSTLSLMCQGDVVSFWNGATEKDYRRQGISSALRRLALNHAMKQGARLGISYLMSEGMALGICKSLGYETGWRFHAMISP
jgi:hypothetical protein